MNKSELISQCRYYAGEKHSPFKTRQLEIFWDIERVYVESLGELDTENASLYEYVGGVKYPGIPYELLITFFGAWNKGAFDTKKELPKFQEFMNEYLEACSDYIPKDKIPSSKESGN